MRSEASVRVTPAYLPTLPWQAMTTLGLPKTPDQPLTVSPFHSSQSINSTPPSRSAFPSAHHHSDCESHFSAIPY